LLRRLEYEFSDDRDEAVLKFDKKLGRAELQGAGGSDLEPTPYRIFTSEDSARSEIGQHILTFDAEGRLIQRVYEKLGGGAKAADALGAYGQAYRYNGLGLVDRVVNTDEDRPTLIGKSGVAAQKWVYDHQGVNIVVEWNGPDGALVENGLGYARLAATTDAHGNVVEARYFGADGKLALSKHEGIAGIVRTLNDHGQLVAESCFGLDGKPTVNKAWGAASTAGRYDAHGDLLEIAYFGLDSQPAVNRQNGAARASQHCRNELFRL
jgi:hypothetical protein